MSESHDSHVLPIKTYLKVFAALLVLTYITVQVSLLDLGDIAIVVAMAVALVKATLVVLFFMHLKYDTGFNRLIFVGSLFFLVIFFVFTMIDLGSRGNIIEQQDTFYLKQEREAEKKIQQLDKPVTDAK